MKKFTLPDHSNIKRNHQHCLSLLAAAPPGRCDLYLRNTPIDRICYGLIALGARAELVVLLWPA
jgi:hypothetical protein